MDRTPTNLEFIPMNRENGPLPISGRQGVRGSNPRCSTPKSISRARRTAGFLMPIWLGALKKALNPRLSTTTARFDRRRQNRTQEHAEEPSADALAYELVVSSARTLP